MIKKALTYSVVITTIIWSVGLLATPLAVGAAVSGDLIKLQCATGAGVSDPCKAVYYLGADGKRYVFPNEKTYKTWYSDFSGVQIVSSTEMSSYAIGGNVTYRPGVKLVKITTDPKVYAVASNGSLRWVTTAAIAESLYGSSWASMVEDVPDAFFVNYTVGSDVNAAADYNKTTETSNATTINDDKNLGGGGASTGTGLTVALASDTPATNYVVGNSIHNKFTKINFTASADGDIVIDQIVARRGGTVASDAAFSGIVLLDGTSLQQTEDAKTLNSDHQAIFNKDLTIPAGTTKSYYLGANMASSLSSYAGQIPSLDLFSVKLSGSAAVIGTLPIVGNYMQLDGTIAIATLTLANGGYNPSASTQRVGVTDYIVSGVKLTANGTEDFKVSRIRFNQGGTAGDSDVSNLDLLIDDAVVATISASSGKYATFDLSANPITIIKGKSKTFDLRLDVSGGSSRTVRFDIKDETDIKAVGQLYGANVKVAAGSGATADADPFWTAVVTTVSEESLRIGPATLVAANVADDSDQVVLGKFEFEAKGEPAVITRLPISFDITTSSAATVGNVTHADLTNITVYDPNGKIVAGPIDTAHGNYVGDGDRIIQVTATSTDTITIPVGTSIYVVKGDIGADFETDDTVQVHIKPNQLTVKGDNTGITITPTPSTEQSSAIMTVKTANVAISLSSSPVAQTVVGGTQNWTFANVILDAANSGEDVKVTTVKVAIHTVTANPSQSSGWTLYDGSTALAVTNDPSSDTSTKTTAGNSATATFTFSTPLILTKGTTKTLTVKGNITTSATSGSVSVGISDSVGADHLTAKGNTSGADAGITMSISDGQAQTLTDAGTLTLTKDSTSPDASLIPANSVTGVTVTVINASARYENVNLEKFYLTAGAPGINGIVGAVVGANDAGWKTVKQVHIYKGNELVKSVTPTSSATSSPTVLVDLTNSPIVVPKDSSVLITVKVDTQDANYELGSVATSGIGSKIKINAAGDVIAKGSQSGATLAAGSKTINNASGNAMILFRSAPVITPNDQLPTGEKVVGGTLQNNTETALYRFKVTAGSTGDIGLASVAFLVNTTTATITGMKIYESGVQVAVDLFGAHQTDNANNDAHVTIFLFDDGDDTLIQNGVVSMGTSKLYELRGQLYCTGAACTEVKVGGTAGFQLLGDPFQMTTLPNSVSRTAATIAFDRSIQWTDFWRTPVLKNSSTTATQTEQWSNGYLIKDSTGKDLAATSTGVTWSFSR